MKRTMKAILLMALMLVSMTSAAFAAEGDAMGAGFYSKGKAANVTVEMQDANGVKVKPAAALDSKGNVVTYYTGAVRMEVTYSGKHEEGDQFMVLLVQGTDLPTAANAIYYIDQVAGEGDVAFDVYPMLPTGTAKDYPMTLYITSSRDGFETVDIPLGYAKSGYKEAGYTKGDVSGPDGVPDTEINALDAVAMIKHIVGNEKLEGNALLAADVNESGSVDAADVLRVLQYVAQLIVEF